MMRLLFALILIICFCFSHFAIGMMDISLYSASVSVLSKSMDERGEAAKEGFKQVLIRLTGTSNIIDNPAIAREVKRAAYYLQDFDYQVASLTASQHTLNLHFNPIDINSLLAREHIPIWNGKRPVLMVWMTYKVNGTDEIISDDYVDEVLPQLRQNAQERGLPLVLPFMDTQELSYLSDPTVTDIPLSTFEMLSKRYVYDAILVGYLLKQDKIWIGKWTLISKHSVLDWEQSNQDVDILIASMFNNISQYFFKEAKTQQSVYGIKT